MSTATELPVSQTQSNDAAAGVKSSGSRRLLRSSSLLLAGQLFSKAANLAIQVLIVRHLSQAGYGAFAYALSIVAIAQNVAIFGLDRAVTRFVPIYQEQRDYNRLYGTLAMVGGLVASLAVATVALYYAYVSFTTPSSADDALSRSLLMILIFLAPLDALDQLIIGMFAVTSSARSIFFRKHLLGPGLKLVVVLALILTDSTVFFLAGGYVLASAFGVVLYATLLARMLYAQGMFQHFALRSVIVPWQAIFAFTLPLLTSDMMYVVMNSVDVVLLQYFGTSVDVAALKAVQPTARMNQMVLASFALLFTPTAARLFARQDRQGINKLYWQNAIWTAVMSFPIFILTFSLAGPITVLLFGERYESSAAILALLSFGYYFNAALGQNGLTLKVFGRVRYVMVINVIAVLFNLAINLLLIPLYGAYGAAIGTCTTLILHNILKQAGLRLGTGIDLFEWHYFRVYLIIVLSAAALLLLQLVTDIPPYASIFLAGLASLAVIRLNRKLLNVNEMFPELLRLPMAKWLFGR